MKNLCLVILCLLGATGIAQINPSQGIPERTSSLEALYQEAKELENNGSAAEINANRLAIKDAWFEVDPEISGLYQPLTPVMGQSPLVEKEIRSSSASRSPEDWSADLLIRDEFIDGVDMDVTKEGHIYIAGFENNADGSNNADIFVYRSTDNGNTFEFWKEVSTSDKEVVKLQTLSFDGNGTNYLLIYLLTDDGLLQAAQWNMATGDYTYQALVSDVSGFSVDRNYPQNTNAQRVFAIYHKEESNCSTGGNSYSARSTAGSYGLEWVDQAILTDCTSEPSIAYAKGGGCHTAFIRNDNLVHKVNSHYNDPASWGSNYLVASNADFDFMNPSIRAARKDVASEKVIILTSQKTAGSSDYYYLETYFKDSSSDFFSSMERYSTNLGDVLSPDTWVRRQNEVETIRTSYVFTDHRANVDDRNDVLTFNGSTFDTPERIAREGLNVWKGFITAIAETEDNLPCAAFAGTSSDGTRGDGLYFNAKSDLMSVEDNILEGLTFYPNPVNNTLNISAKKRIENLSIYSLLGQQVLKISPEQSSFALDVSSLFQGVYVMKVEVEGKISSYKIIKD